MEPCPYCGKEMRAGYLQSSRYLVWDPEIKYGAILPGKEGFCLTRKLFSENAVPSRYCEHCCLLITPRPPKK